MRLPNGYGTVYKLSGKRRNSFIVRKTIGWHYDETKKRQVQEYLTIGYAPTKAEGLRMLAEYNKNPYDVNAAKITFQEVYEKWSSEKYSVISNSNVQGYMASYHICAPLYDRIFKDIKLAELQHVVDTCGKNYPTLKKLKILFNQLYDFAMKNEICSKDYSKYVNITKFKDRNPNKFDRNKFSEDEIEKLWVMKDDKYYQIVLMLIYNGVRISEFLNLKKEQIHLDEQYFDVLESKTENGIRKVPIADKVLPFYQAWFDSAPQCPYLLHTENGRPFKYRNYYNSYFLPLMENLGMEHTPHCCRHTCVSLLVTAGVEQTFIKKIVGHSSAMNLTEKVYTHIDVKELVNAINKI
ncbi:MAG: tyrosine-type recombinase/integrase [Lachnospiraceae bacterium]|nr:tyrosine-type recombinase/integrase [Lachnospiraceae bacterium]